MTKKEIQFTYTIHQDEQTLPETDRDLIAQARLVSQKAYAPYSNFKVGAAIRTTSGNIVSGSNQENGAFPIGQCAERVALYTMVHAMGRLQIDTIAIVVDGQHVTSPASPCGSCRQVLSEYRSYQPQPIRILLGTYHGNELHEIRDINDLLPFAFNGKFLGF
jgi:cytidine deaminase